MIVAGWIDWAARIPGMRQDKQYADINRAQGIVWHSQEGSGLQPMINIHQADPAPSFMFHLALDGTLRQFTPITASVWCSGNRQANTYYWPVEAEGRSPAPLNAAQLITARRLIDEWSTYTGRTAMRAMPGRTQWEHREVAQMWSPNAGPTACPSERYAPLWAALEEEIDMPTLDRLEQEIRDLRRDIDLERTRREALNAAIVERFDLLETAAGPYARMHAAYEALRAARLIKEGDTE